MAPTHRQVNVRETQWTPPADSAAILAVSLLFFASNDSDVLDAGGHNLIGELQKQAGSGDEIKVDALATQCEPSADNDRKCSA